MHRTTCNRKTAAGAQKTRKAFQLDSLPAATSCSSFVAVAAAPAAAFKLRAPSWLQAGNGRLGQGRRRRQSAKSSHTNSSYASSLRTKSIRILIGLRRRLQLVLLRRSSCAVASCSLVPHSCGLVCAPQGLLQAPLGHRIRSVRAHVRPHSRRRLLSTRLR